MTALSLSEKFVIARIKGATRSELLTLQDEAGKELKEIKAAKSDVYARFPGVHGRFQQSQLDVLDIRENKVCAMFDELSEMIFITKE